ncbi:uncharacterized protein LOC143181185 [Calliopsis andreniformis]|uniref:uncharacterized protein LOC143181185 n=1 Tax=Calliopsis andreniformis TaxID=337506 RepID=UPI003FCEE5AE
MLHIIYKVLLIGLTIVSFVSHGDTRSCSVYKDHDQLEIRPIVGPFDHSEGPIWDHRTQKLYFVDIDAQKICRFDPPTKKLTCIYIANGPVGFLARVQGEPHKFVAGAATDFVLINWDSYENYTRSAPETLTVVDRDRNGTRWNDGKADSSGRIWAGTIGPEVNEVVVPDQASFYRIDSDLKPKKELSPVTNSNGLAWNIEDDTLYYIDTPTLKIAAFDFNSTEGTISNKRIVFDLQQHNISGLPDGMTIDTNGNLWIALYSGGGVLNVNPRTGEVIRFLKLPVSKVTSVAFGGPLCDILFVTTSSRGETEQEKVEEPYAGYVFAVHGLNVRGLFSNSFKLHIRTMSKVTIERIAGPYQLGEGPHWDPDSKKLYFVDIFDQKIYRYDPFTKSLTSTFVEEGPVGFAIPVDGVPGKLVAGVSTDIALVTWDGEKDLAKCTVKKLVAADSDPAETRWNDAKADSSGRIWGGTMSNLENGQFPPNKGSFYSVNNDLVLKKHVTPVTISNGIAWSLNDDTLYYIDSPTQQVVAYDYSPQTGDISNKKTVFDLQKTNIPGMPDGMTIDSSGNLWVAVFGGGGVCQVDPKTGELMRFIKIENVSNVTSVTFGGDELDTLYVTTAYIGLNENQIKEQPNAGCVFAVKGLGVHGLPANSFKPLKKLI